MYLTENTEKPVPCATSNYQRHTKNKNIRDFTLLFTASHAVCLI